MKRILFVFFIFIAFTAYSIAGETSHRKLYETGVYWVGKGKHEKAIVYFTKALKVNPKSIRVYLMRGKSYLALARCKEAREDFYSVLDLMQEVGGSQIRWLFSNSDTDVMNAIKDDKFDIVIGTAY